MISLRLKALPNSRLTSPNELASTPYVRYISLMPQPRTSLNRSKKMIQITKYMKSFTIIPIACDRNAARYSMAESRFAFQTASRNLSSFIANNLDGRVAPHALRGEYRDHHMCRNVSVKAGLDTADEPCLLDQRYHPPFTVR